MNIAKRLSRSLAKSLAKSLVGGEGIAKRLLFSCEENQTVAGQIIDTKASTFKILNDRGEFTIDSLGNITFVTAPDYEIKNVYDLRVLANSGTLYIITVTVTDVSSDFELLYDTDLTYNTQF
jgi:hypothetical protein